MTATYGPHVIVAREGPVIRISLDRPERLNAFIGSMRWDLLAALQDAEASDARVIVLTGAGRAFSAGADVEALAEMMEAGDLDGFSDNVRAGISIVRAIRSATQLVLCAINGVAAGAGASLAAACDLRIAAATARIGFTFTRIGLHPDWGATHTVPLLVGAGRAAELLYSGRLVAADEGLAIGLFDRVVAPEKFGEAVSHWCEQLAAPATPARAMLKAALRRKADVALEPALEAEIEAQVACFQSPEALESLRSFLAGRTGAPEGGSPASDGPTDPELRR